MMGFSHARAGRADELRRALARHGHRATHQRLEIYRALTSTDEHPDAETLFSCLHERMPMLSLDTVYRTLALFVDDGLARRIASLSKRARFEAWTGPHAHFVCTECDRIADVPRTRPRGAEELASPGEFGRVRSIQTDFIGTCRACMRRGQQTAGEEKTERLGEPMTADAEGETV